MTAVADAHRGALAELRNARRRHRASEVDIFDAFYQAYLTAVACAVAVLVASDVVGDQRLTSVQVARVADRGPVAIGLAMAVLAVAGLRSGARGGPLVLPAADVRYVLMAPISRGAALRGPALRHLRFLAFSGTVAGAVAGVLASHRLPGGLAAWAACGAAVGALAALLVTGSAFVACGLRLSPIRASLLASALLGWSGADAITGVRTSPTTLVGELALWPIRFRAPAAAAIVLPVVVVAAGVIWIGGSSIEAAERRASLASQIRFAVTLQDLRTVVLLRRQLTQEHPRSRPWVRLAPLSRGRTLVWRRDLRGLARWPAARVLRVLVLGAVAGLSMAGVWAGTTPLIIVAALALFLAGLDALEPLAQEIDHPDRPDSLPMELGRLRLLHVPASLATLFVVVGVGWGVAFALGPARLVGPVGAAVIVPVALLATAGAAVSIVMGPPTADNMMLPVEAAGAKLVFRLLWSPAIVGLGLTPLLVARSAAQRGLAPGPAAASAAVFPIMVGVLSLGWLRVREQARTWMTPPPATPVEPKP